MSKTYEQAMMEVQAALTLAQDIWTVEGIRHMRWIGEQYAALCIKANETPCMEDTISSAINRMGPLERAVAQDLVVSTAWALLLEDDRQIA